MEGTNSVSLKRDANSRSRRLDATARRLFSDKAGRALLIYQDGKLKLEHYANGIEPDARFNSYSMVKSLIGALVLRAHVDGRIADLNDPVGAYLHGLGDDKFGRTPILSFLRMRSGVIFDADDAKTTVGQGAKDIEKMRMNPFGPMARLHMLGLGDLAGRLRVEAGARGRYNYQNVNTSVLGRLLEEVYGQPLEWILSEKVWKPAGAATAYWRRHGEELPVTAYCCLYATPMDWVRIGIFLISNGGKERPFLPEKLWKRFLGQNLTYDDVRKGRYGLHLYHNVLDRNGEALQGPFSYMFGSRGQVVYLMPEKKLVVVRFGEQIQLFHSTLYSAWNSVHPKD
ncbi:MAG: beta-lactamase family protein [Hyphomicrobiaceae bacterium]|nr:beta-lactamase family protein [Hyphomicrobiaceae bacterium]